MKKLITILTIMIVLVGAVFAVGPEPEDAEGTATINVKTAIGPQYPTFQLKVTTATSGQGDVNFSTVGGANGQATIDTNALIANPVTLAFAIDQITNSRCTVNYTINIKATDLVWAGAADPAAPAADEFFDVSAIGSLTATGAINNKRTVAVAQQGIKDGYEAALSVGYLGGKFINVTKQENPDGKEIGTFSYTWAKNEDAKVGNYSATVVVEVVVAD